MNNTISKILYSKAALVWFCGFSTAIVGYLIYYTITGDWSGYSLLDNIPVYCCLAVYFMEYTRYRKTGECSTILTYLQLVCWIITAYNVID